MNFKESGTPTYKKYIFLCFYFIKYVVHCSSIQSQTGTHLLFPLKPPIQILPQTAHRSISFQDFFLFHWIICETLCLNSFRWKKMHITANKYKILSFEITKMFCQLIGHNSCFIFCLHTGKDLKIRVCIFLEKEY